jgi:hypothetical protein
MHYPGHEIHPDAKARSGMLSELARRWAQGTASEWTETPRHPGGDEAEEREDSSR